MRIGIKQRNVRACRIGLASFALGLAGCGSTPDATPVFATKDRPAATAFIKEGGDVYCLFVNGRPTPQKFRLTPMVGDGARRFEVAAGKCLLVVRYERAPQKNVTFDAAPGKEYVLDSWLGPHLLNLPMSAKDWDAQLKDAATGAIVTQTHDAHQ